MKKTVIAGVATLGLLGWAAAAPALGAVNGTGQAQAGLRGPQWCDNDDWHTSDYNCHDDHGHGHGHGHGWCGHGHHGGWGHHGLGHKDAIVDLHDLDEQLHEDLDHILSDGHRHGGAHGWDHHGHEHCGPPHFEHHEKGGYGHGDKGHHGRHDKGGYGHGDKGDYGRHDEGGYGHGDKGHHGHHYNRHHHHKRHHHHNRHHHKRHHYHLHGGVNAGGGATRMQQMAAADLTSLLSAK